MSPASAALSGPEEELPLPDPYPEYLACPSCGEPEVEIWSDRAGGLCSVCGALVERDLSRSSGR